MKRILMCIVLSLSLVVCGFGSGFGLLGGNAYGASFSDINEHWAKSYILKAADKGIISGYPDGTFLPDKPVSRAEFTKMINNAFGNENTVSINFSDVPAFEWYYTDIAKSVSAGYAGGYDDGTFLPNNHITRQEAAVMLSRLVPTYGYSGSLTSYGDNKDVSDWAKDSVSKIIGKKYMGAYDDGKLHPLDKLTRAQAAKIICDMTDKETIVKTTLTIKEEDTKVSGKIYSNGIIINKDVEDGDVTVDNCIILGHLYVQGGGTDTVTVSNSRVASMSVNKTDSAVRVLAKGETRILDTNVWNEAHLHTKSLSGGLFGTGFDKISVRQKGIAYLDGNFPQVEVAGSDCNLTLEAGTITTLNVGSSGKDSEIDLDSYFTITTANVDAPSFFKGDGEVKTMNANVSGITYQTKPTKINTKTGITAPKYSDEDLDISFTPTRGATGVDVDSTIKLSFSTAITKTNGKAITSSDLEDIIELRKKTSSGTLISFTASINSSKKTVTITPDDDLDYDTKYYVIIDSESFKDSDGNLNEAFSTYFTTDDDEGSSDISSSPSRGATGVSVGTDIKIYFDSATTKANGGSLTSSNLTSLIELRSKTSSGTKVSFTASINSSKKTVTISPKSNLDYSTKYYVIIDEETFKDADGNLNDDFSTYFTTEADATAAVSSITASSNESSITVSVTPSQSGTLYGVLLASGAKAPTAAQVIAGQDGSGAAAHRNGGSVSVTKNTAKTLSAFTGLDDSTTYVYYCVLKTSSATSAVKSKSIATTAPNIASAQLTALSVSGAESMSPAFSKSVTDYTITMPFGETSATISASAGTSATLLYSSDNKDYSTEFAALPISGSLTNKIYVKVTESGKYDTIYTLNIKVAGKTDLSDISIAGASGTADRKIFTVPSGNTSLSVTITAEDPAATVVCTQLKNSDDRLGSLSGTLNLDPSASTTVVSYTIKSNLDEKSGTFTVVVVEGPSQNTSGGAI